jgi:hypothetical protein
VTFPFPFSETWTRLPSGGRDKNGDPLGDQDPVEVAGCVSWPEDGNGSGGDEQSDRRATVTAGRVLMLPPGTATAPSDRWSRGGVVYEQVGGEGTYGPSPFTGTQVLTVQLKRVTG